MAQDKKAAARKVYDSMIKALNKKGWKFKESTDGKMVISSDYQGEDIPIGFIVRVDEERQVLQFLSQLPFSISESKRVDAAIAVCVANWWMVNGSFDYNFENGNIIFRLTTSFVDCEVGEDFFMSMIATAVVTTDEYNDKFLMLSKGTLSLEQFIKQANS